MAAQAITKMEAWSSMSVRVLPTHGFPTLAASSYDNYFIIYYFYLLYYSQIQSAQWNQTPTFGS